MVNTVSKETKTKEFSIKIRSNDLTYGRTQDILEDLVGGKDDTHLASIFGIWCKLYMTKIHMSIHNIQTGQAWNYGYDMLTMKNNKIYLLKDKKIECRREGGQNELKFNVKLQTGDKNTTFYRGMILPIATSTTFKGNFSFVGMGSSYIGDSYENAQIGTFNYYVCNNKNPTGLYTYEMEKEPHKVNRTFPNTTGLFTNLGAYCRCPDGQSYPVMDQDDNCKSLACYGGTPSLGCTSKLNPARNQAVVCANHQKKEEVDDPENYYLSGSKLMVKKTVDCIKKTRYIFSAKLKTLSVGRQKVEKETCTSDSISKQTCTALGYGGSCKCNDGKTYYGGNLKYMFEYPRCNYFEERGLINRLVSLLWNATTINCSVVFFIL